MLRRYIKWAQEQFAANGSKAELQQVLEAATRSLSGTNRYNNDVRLLRIWVQYVSIQQQLLHMLRMFRQSGVCCWSARRQQWQQEQPNMQDNGSNPNAVPATAASDAKACCCARTNLWYVAIIQMCAPSCRLTACPTPAMCSCTWLSVTLGAIMRCCMRRMPHTWSSRATSSRQSWCTRMASTGETL